MKRRAFLSQGAAGAATLSLAGCSVLGKKVPLHQSAPAFTDDYFKATMKKPSGTMPMGEIGSTGIKVSKFTFGSHMNKYIVPFQKEREFEIREAHDMGITMFDVYDIEQECYQYEPMGRYLKPVINDVVISIDLRPYDGRTLEQELERDLRLFNRDHIDLVRTHSYQPDNTDWGQKWHYWEFLFKMKEQGKIRAVGVPIHYIEQLDRVMKTYPIDFVIFPYNFYHNILWDGNPSEGMADVAKELHRRGIGVITMKPFGSDSYANSFIAAARQIDPLTEVNVPRTMLKWIINSGLNPDTTMGGMYNINHVYDDTAAFFNPAMTEEETMMLERLRKVARVAAGSWAPAHYKFLENWASPDTDSHETA